MAVIILARLAIGTGLSDPDVLTGVTPSMVTAASPTDGQGKLELPGTVKEAKRVADTVWRGTVRRSWITTPPARAITSTMITAKIQIFRRPPAFFRLWPAPIRPGGY